MYAALYLCAHAAILTSTELYSIVAASEAASSSDSSTLTIVGAREGTGDDADLARQTSGFDLSKPILVSAAIVSALSIGLFSPIERGMRSYAHWIAAIPRGVYHVIGSLKRANYAAISHRTKGPLETALNESLAEDQASETNAGILREIRESLKTIDVLYASVLESSRDQIFAVHKHRPIETLIEKMEGEYEQVRSALVGDGLNEGNIEAVHMKAGRLRNNIQALFALLFIRNDKIEDTTRPSPTPSG
ncbi:hypothetical protein [uncultured Tateyamaria sp.]|uniref:hypothetical protein n=1 Tax=uncultured Tateyamaria sp. TaxID=455651 RepID=UPI00260F8437|nr:hypothetical protein [uncultured Tateyamaria sp.]